MSGGDPAADRAVIDHAEAAFSRAHRLRQGDRATAKIGPERTARGPRAAAGDGIFHQKVDTIAGCDVPAPESLIGDG